MLFGIDFSPKSTYTRPSTIFDFSALSMLKKSTVVLPQIALLLLLLAAGVYGQTVTPAADTGSRLFPAGWPQSVPDRPGSFFKTQAGTLAPLLFSLVEPLCWQLRLETSSLRLESSLPSTADLVRAPSARSTRVRSGRVDPPDRTGSIRGFRWGSALKQSVLFLGIEHGLRLTGDAGPLFKLGAARTRRELNGPFFQDWFDSLKTLRGWSDGGHFLTNYIFHPMQGATSGWIQIHNDPSGVLQEFENTSAYWKSRLKAFGWASLYSTQFELGPLSEASIGNLGHAPGRRRLGYVDLVITPTLGTVFLIGEDLVELYVIKPYEKKSTSPGLVGLVRVLLNPMRGFANLLRFKKPWHRDTR